MQAVPSFGADWLNFSNSLKAIKIKKGKSAANLAKRGIYFETAQNFWLDPDLLEIKAKTVDELRSMVIGKIDDKYWSAIVTHRDGRLRLISVRRPRDMEIDIYEST